MPRPSATTVQDPRESNRSRALWPVLPDGPLTRDRSLRLPFGAVEIVQADLGPDAVALGGATRPADRLLSARAVNIGPAGGRRRLRPAVAPG